MCRSNPQATLASHTHTHTIAITGAHTLAEPERSLNPPTQTPFLRRDTSRRRRRRETAPQPATTLFIKKRCYSEGKSLPCYYLIHDDIFKYCISPLGWDCRCPRAPRRSFPAQSCLFGEEKKKRIPEITDPERQNNQSFLNSSCTLFTLGWLSRALCTFSFRLPSALRLEGQLLLAIRESILRRP